MNSRDHFPIQEAFASIQGEGLFVGEAQVFVRLMGCPLRCRWCDTPRALGLPGANPIAAEDSEAPAWSSLDDAAQRIDALDPSGSQAISITGGEPLMWPEFITGLRARLPGRRLHLETAGAFPAALEEVLGSVDHISADHKLPADLTRPVALGPEFESPPRNAADWRETRRRVLALVAERDACFKLVVAAERGWPDFEEILADHVQFAPRLPLFLQPVTPTSGVAAPDPDQLLDLACRASSMGLSVRVVPQQHVQLGVR